MRILIYGINYAPELTGIGKYTGEMGSWLVKQGHTVHVVTAMPYYPTWSVSKNYKGRLWHKEDIDGAKVYRCPLYVPKKISSVKRILHEFSFLLSTLPIFFRMLFAKKYDVVISVAPPFHLGFLPLLYAKIRRTDIITHVQDLQVDAARELGMIKNERFLSILFAAEKYLLRKSTAVSTISMGMQRKLEDKGIDSHKCLSFPNWVDESMIKPLRKQDSLRKEFGLSQEDKVILYSGNLGEKQGLENIIETAREFIDQPEIKFVIVGSGGFKQRLEEMVLENGLTNVLFYSLQPYEKLSALLAMADIHLILQKKNASDLMMPSKLTSILAAGGCCIVTALPGTTLYDVVTNNNVGIIVEPEDSIALSNGIKKALSSNLEIYRKNARRYAEKFLSKEAIMHSWENQLIRIQNVGRKAAHLPRLTGKLQSSST